MRNLNRIFILLGTLVLVFIIWKLLSRSEQEHVVPIENQQRVSVDKKTDPVIPRKKSIRKRGKPMKDATINQIYDSLKSQLDDFSTYDQQCEEQFRSYFPKDDFIDPQYKKLSHFEDYQHHYQGLIQLMDFRQSSSTIEDLIDVLLDTDIDINLLKTMLDQSIYCLNVSYTNLMTTLIHRFGADPKFTQEQRRIFTGHMLDYLQRYISSFKRAEYTMVAMEGIFSMVEKGLLPKEMQSELEIQRQDLILAIQEYESEYNLSGQPETNADIIKTYRDSISSVNETLLVLVEKYFRPNDLD